MVALGGGKKGPRDQGRATIGREVVATNIRDALKGGEASCESSPA